MRNEVINLLSTVEGVNEFGDTILTSTEREVFAKKLSIGQTEFYQSQATGFKPELKFEIFVDEYENEQYLTYNNISYRIIRTYSKNNIDLELVCERGVLDGTA